MLLTDQSEYVNVSKRGCRKVKDQRSSVYEHIISFVMKLTRILTSMNAQLSARVQSKNDVYAYIPLSCPVVVSKAHD